MEMNTSLPPTPSMNLTTQMNLTTIIMRKKADILYDSIHIRMRRESKLEFYKSDVWRQ